MPSFSNTSLQKLSTCDSKIQYLFKAVVNSYDCTILQGHRTQEEQKALYKSGRSKVIRGKHNLSPSKAVDVSPYPIPEKWGEGDSKAMAEFYYFAGYVLGIAESLNIKIRWGGDWDSDNKFIDQTFDDLVHFEVVE